MNKSASYTNQITSNLDCSEELKKDIEDEIIDHLEMLEQEYLDKGFSREKAIELAIHDFGDPDLIRFYFEKNIHGGIMIMKKVIYSIIGLFLAIIGILCITEFTELLSKYQDAMSAKVPLGEGIGVYFYGLEINDRVKNENIMSYGYSFFAIGALLILSGIYMIYFHVFKNKKSNI